MNEQPQPNTGDQIARFINEFAEAVGRAITEWVEHNRPALEALAEFASQPEVRAMVERAKAERAEYRPCHCLCGRAHPGDQGICDGEGVTSREFVSDAIGRVEVPLCAPCAVAQGITEGIPR